MAITALFVEILVIGAIAELWITSVLLAWVQPSHVRIFVAHVAPLKDVSSLLLIFLLAITYGIGWVVNFASERLFKVAFQSRIRDPLFEGCGVNYESARLVVLQKGSPAFLHEIQLDRHVIRIARSNALNFALFGISLFFHHTRIDFAVLASLIVLLLLLSIGSFFQWRTRYTFQYQRVASAARELGIGKIPESTTASTGLTG